MTDLKRRSLIAALGAAPIAVPLLTHAQTVDVNSKFKQVSSRERIRQRYFPNLELTSHEGRKLKFYDDMVKDKLVIFNMFYAKCEGICSPVTRNLVRGPSSVMFGSARVAETVPSRPIKAPQHSFGYVSEPCARIAASTRASNRSAIPIADRRRSRRRPHPRTARTGTSRRRPGISRRRRRRASGVQH